jgi:hypothetical protein
VPNVHKRYLGGDVPNVHKRYLGGDVPNVHKRYLGEVMCQMFTNVSLHSS